MDSLLEISICILIVRQTVEFIGKEDRRFQKIVKSAIDLRKNPNAIALAPKFVDAAASIDSGVTCRCTAQDYEDGLTRFIFPRLVERIVVAVCNFGDLGQAGGQLERPASLGCAPAPVARSHCRRIHACLRAEL